MLHIFAYALGVMYTPGPVNILAFSQGLQGTFRPFLRFCAGVGIAMLILFLLLGYTGQMIIGPRILPFISLAGCLYIAHLAWKVWAIRPQLGESEDKSALTLGFRDGLCMQLLNPKAFIATLPIATIQFPAAQVTGAGILLLSCVLSFLAFGAPVTYAWLGKRMGRNLENVAFMQISNRIMAAMLLYVSASMAYEQVYCPLLRA